MSRLLGAVAIIIVIVLLYAFLSNPSPNSGNLTGTTAPEITEQASSTSESAADQAGDAVASLQEQGEQALETATEAVTDTVDETTAALGDGADALRAQGAALIQKLEENGLLTQDGFDYQQIATMIDNSPLAQATKDSVMAILVEIRDAPEQFDAGLKKLQDLFQG